MMSEMKEFMAVREDGTEVLGKILYYSLSTILVDKRELSRLCDAMGFPCNPSSRLSLGDAFQSATGDVYDRKAATVGGETHIFKVYCRDNKHTTKNVLSRELVKEILGAETNQYKKLANVSYDKENNVFSYDNLTYDPEVEPLDYCQKAEELFDLYQRCAGRKQIETLLEHYVTSMQASKLLSHGKMYFIPRTEMGRLSLFEDFVEALEGSNLNQSRFRVPLSANSMYVVDDAKQREKMAAAFYATIGQEIQTYQERIGKLIENHCASQAVMDRWALKIQGLEQKRRTYEDVLRQELHTMDSEFDTLRYLAEELRLQARGAHGTGQAA